MIAPAAPFFPNVSHALTTLIIQPSCWTVKALGWSPRHATCLAHRKTASTRVEAALFTRSREGRLTPPARLAAGSVTELDLKCHKSENWQQEDSR